MYKLIMVLSSSIILVCLLCNEAKTACHAPDVSREAVIRKMGGRQTEAMLRVYRAEGRGCYIGNHGTSFGPFQLHYPGLADIFTKLTGLNARNKSTVPAQVTFMKRWGTAHGGFSSHIWHGLRGHHHFPHRHRH